MSYAKTTLRRQLEKYTYIEESKARKWFCQLASALAYLHKRRIAHRDLKTENVLIDGSDNIKLCDFGFSTLCSSNDRELPSSTFCGSLGYCAPEILKRTPYNPCKTDIWSLGVVLYKMVIGGMPFGEGNDLGSVRRIALAQTRILEFPPYPQVTGSCRDLIRSLLAFESDHRITLYDIFQCKWITEIGGVEKISEDLPNTVAASRGSSLLQETILNRLTSVTSVMTSQEYSTKRVEAPTRATSVLSRIRMRLPSLSSRSFRRGNVRQ